MTWTTTIFGTPTTKKNHSRFIRPGLILPSKPWCAYEKDSLPQLKAAWKGQDALCRPLNMKATIHRAKLSGDLIGYLQGICDLLEKSGIVENDKWILGFDGSRLEKDAVNPRVVIVLSYLEDTDDV